MAPENETKNEPKPKRKNKTKPFNATSRIYGSGESELGNYRPAT